MPITALPTPPSRNDPANFAERGDAFMAALPGFVTEANALQTDVNDKQEAVTAAANTATMKAGEASASATAAEGFKNTADTKAGEAAGSASSAASSANTAQNWATKTDAPVAGGEYSAKYHAEQARLAELGAIAASGTPNDGSVTDAKVADGSKLKAIVDLILAGNTHIGGIPIADAYRDKKIEIVAGVIRQRAADRTKWDFINDSSHHPIGVSGVYATASGNDITINFAKTFGKVLTFIAGPDEHLASARNITVGASVGTSSAVLNLGGSITLYREIYWNGSAWVTDTVPGAYSEGSVTTSYSTGTLTVNHSYCPGLMTFVEPLHSAGTVSLFPFVRGGGNTSTAISWMDQSFTTSASASPTTSMRARWTKQYHGPIHADGTNGSDTLILDSGNIWFFAIMELP